jgi:hypothetical protein
MDKESKPNEDAAHDVHCGMGLCEQRLSGSKTQTGEVYLLETDA